MDLMAPVCSGEYTLTYLSPSGEHLSLMPRRMHTQPTGSFE